MSDQYNDVIYKTNINTRESLHAGIASILPYLLWGINLILAKTTRSTQIVMILWQLIPLPIYFLGGVIGGTIGLIKGGLAIEQINNTQGVAISNRSAIIGIVLSILGIIANVLFCYTFVLSMLRD